MNRSRGAMRVLLLGIVVLAGMFASSAPVAMAQSSDVDPAFYESELSGYEIEIEGDEFEIYQAEVQNYSHGEGEIVEIASNTAYIQVAFFDDTDTNQETLEIYNDAFAEDIDDFEVLDEEDNGEAVHTFAIATYEGVEFYYYLSVTEDVEGNIDLLQRIFATDATFFEDFTDAQEDISIDRDGFLEDVDVADLEDAAGAEREQREDEPEDEPTEEPQEEPTEEPAEAVPTIDPQGAAVRELVVVDAQLVTTPDVAVGQGGAELPAYEEIPLQLGEAEALLLLLMRPESPEATLDIALSIFTPENGTIENIGTDADRSSAWSLDYVQDAGQEYLLYVHVQNDRFQRFHYAEILFTPVDSLPQSIEGFRQGAQIDGVPLFAEAELETLEFLLSGGEEPDEPVDGTEEEDKADTRDQSGDDSSSLDLESQGLVSSNEFVSPQYGVSVEWNDEAWVADAEWEMTAVSDEETGIDSVILFPARGESSLMVQILASEGEEPEEYVATWESDDYVAEFVHEDAELLLADSSSRSGGVVYLTYDAEGNEVILSQEAIYIDDDIVAIVTLFGSPQDFADAYADAEDYVAVDGNDAAGTFTAREIERALD